MNSKGARLAFVFGLILVIVVAGVYFYEKQETPQNSLPPSQSTVVNDGSGSNANKASDKGSGADKVPANSNSAKTESAASETTTSQQQQVYPDGVTPVQHVTADMKGQKVTVK